MFFVPILRLISTSPFVNSFLKFLGLPDSISLSYIELIAGQVSILLGFLVPSGKWGQEPFSAEARGAEAACHKKELNRKMWTQRDSNSRPPRCHRGALPTAPWALYTKNKVLDNFSFLFQFVISISKNFQRVLH